MSSQIAKETMNAGEKRALVGLASLYAFRMIGLFMVLPVMMTYGMAIDGATAALLGLALGAYGITQSLFQIPLGWLSDRIGRKPVIAGGLLMFAFGSLIAATADNVNVLIIGRVLQGSGAIASSTMALLTDLTREQFRTQALAAVGITIGLSFTLSMMIGPWIATVWGFSGIFWLSGLLSIFGLAVLFWFVPNPTQDSSHLANGHFFRDAARVLRNPDLLRLDFGIFVLHMGLMATFIVVPISLLSGGLSEQYHGWLYVPVMIVAFLMMVPFMIIAEKKKLLVQVFSAAVALMLVVQVAFYFAPAGWVITGLLLTVYFMAFNYLEAAMPSLLSRLVPKEVKGTAMGVFNTAQFMGAAIGGVIGGTLYQSFGAQGVYVATGLILALWLWLSLRQQIPGSILSARVTAPGSEQDGVSWAARVSESLLQLDGVEQVEIESEHRAARISYRSGVLDEYAVRRAAK
jgi:predicted MFS family arabinose efflux permease